MPTCKIAPTLIPSGVLMIGGSLVFAEAAWLHMREFVQTYGEICGASSSAAHCPACYASVLLFASGVAALILAQADRPAVRQARVVRSE